MQGLTVSLLEGGGDPLLHTKYFTQPLPTEIIFVPGHLQFKPECLDGLIGEDRCKSDTLRLVLLYGGTWAVA